MDIGIVVVIAVNAIVIGISTDHPENTGLWEILEIAAHAACGVGGRPKTLRVLPGFCHHQPQPGVGMKHDKLRGSRSSRFKAFFWRHPICCSSMRLACICRGGFASKVFFVIYLAEFLVKNIWWGTPVYFSSSAAACRLHLGARSIVGANPQTAQHPPVTGGPDRNWNWFDFACLIISAVATWLRVRSLTQPFSDDF